MKDKELKLKRLVILKEIDKLSDKCNCNTHGGKVENCKVCLQLEKLGAKLTKLVRPRPIEIEKVRTKSTGYVSWTEERVNFMRANKAKYTPKQMADVMGIPLSTLKNALQRFKISCKRAKRIVK